MRAEAEVLRAPEVAAPVPPTPLAVDLDGTLVKTDLLLESLAALLRQRPWYALRLPLWALKGKAHFKRQIASRVCLDVRTLPYRQELLDYLEEQRAQGRPIVLATGGDLELARQVADHLQLFDLVLASDGITNLAGASKRDRLVEGFGQRGYDYAGNGRQDLPVWASARKAIVVNPSPLVRSGVAGVAEIERVFDDGKRPAAGHLEALRLPHWLKNLLIFVPFLAAHPAQHAGMLGPLLLAFLSFGCLASSGYLINDLLDLAADRRHPTKRLRPLAAGDAPLGYAIPLVAVLLMIGCLAGALVSPLFLAVASSYFALSLTYSLYVKKFAVLDVLFLAGLYAIRILGGSAAISIWPSHWLLAFSTFLFFSLALVKRYGELAIMKPIDGAGARARGYESADAELLSAMGISSGYLAVLVLALYINSQAAPALYSRYELLWLLCPLLLYWISHVWLVAHRGRLPDDPVLFTVRDRTSRVLILLMVAVTLVAL